MSPASAAGLARAVAGDLQAAPRSWRGWPAGARQVWADRRTWPLAIPLAAALCVWTVTGLRGWPLAPLAVLLIHAGTHPRFRRGRRRQADAAGVRWAAHARAGWAWLTLAGAGLALTPSAWPLLPLAALEVTVLAVGTGTLRARGRLTRRLLREAAGATGAGPGQVRITGRRWDGRHLLAGSLHYPPDWPVSVQARRDHLLNALRWHLTAQAASEAGGREYVFGWAPAARTITWEAAPPLPPNVPDRVWPTGLPGVVAGITTTEHADTTVDGLPVLLWRPEAHLLIAGVTRRGKTVLLRGLVRRGLAAGAYPGGVRIVDGKASGDYLAFAGRAGVDEVANPPSSWRAALEAEMTIMQARYEAISAWQAGTAPRPDTPRRLLVIDEVQQVAAVVGTELVEQVARLALAAEVTMILATQRPDTASAIPGAARDNVADRIIVGPMSRQGGEMMLEAAWREATTIPAVKGRCLALLDGRLISFQAPNLPTPAQDPTVEGLYPPRVAPPPPDPEPAAEPEPVEPETVPVSTKRRTRRTTA